MDIVGNCGSRVHGSFDLLDVVKIEQVEALEELIERIGEPIVWSVGSAFYLRFGCGSITKISKFMYRIDFLDFDEN